MKDPIKLLRDEHTFILEALEVGKHIQKIEEPKTYFALMRDFIVFIRNYTEIYHYPKEEHILYPMLRNSSAKFKADLIYEICDDHQDLRTMITELETHYLNYDYRQLFKTMNTYLFELQEHIQLENKQILSQITNSFTPAELEVLEDKFTEWDMKQGGKEDLKKTFLKLNMQLA